MAGAWPDIVQHEQNGLLVPIDDVEATRTALSALMLDPELRARLAKAARSDVMAKFDVRHEAQTLCALYERIRAL
jgi:glycosyltransferase involved in cell wall biosynthesis